MRASDAVRLVLCLLLFSFGLGGTWKYHRSRYSWDIQKVFQKPRIEQRFSRPANHDGFKGGHIVRNPWRSTPRGQFFEETSKEEMKLHPSAVGSTEVYWVDAGAYGNGSRHAPAGNITYVLDTYELDDDIINVNAGIYNNTIENFPLKLNARNLTLQTNSPSAEVILHGSKETAGLNITALNITCKGLTFEHAWNGILIHSTTNTNVLNNSFGHNTNGICLINAENTNIEDNYFTKNGYAGVYLADDCDNHNIVSNQLIENWIGVSLLNSGQNTLHGNRFVKNKNAGISIESSCENFIWRNDFVANDIAVIDESGKNYFNSSRIGNFWSDYTGQDTDGNGIGDTPYEIAGPTDSKDYLPSMTSFLNYAVISIIEPSQQPTPPIICSHNVTIRWQGWNDKGEPYHYAIKIDDGEWKSIAHNTSYRVSDLRDGLHRVTVRLIDNAGNVGQDSTRFIVDTNPPSIAITAPQDGKQFETGNVAVIWNGTDQGSGISYFSLRINNGYWSPLANKTSYQFLGLEEGAYRIAVKAIDRTGKTSMDTVNFTVEISGFSALDLKTKLTIVVASGCCLEGLLIAYYIKERHV